MHWAACGQHPGIQAWVPERRQLRQVFSCQPAPSGGPEAQQLHGCSNAAGGAEAAAIAPAKLPGCDTSKGAPTAGRLCRCSHPLDGAAGAAPTRVTLLPVPRPPQDAASRQPLHIPQRTPLLRHPGQQLLQRRTALCQDPCQLLPARLRLLLPARRAQWPRDLSASRCGTCHCLGA